MTRFRLLLSAATLMALASCGYATRLPNTATMPPGALHTNGDIDVRSLNIAAYDFGRHMQDPAQAAGAIAALDYMGGKLNTSPRWTTSMPALWRAQMLESRKIIRAYVGISPDAPSQAVVDTMLNLAQAYRANDQAAVQTLLATPIFTVPPAEVQAKLADIPVNPTVNNATTHADAYAFSFTVPG
jgi:hypothetical protein